MKQKVLIYIFFLLLWFNPFCSAMDILHIRESSIPPTKGEFFDSIYRFYGLEVEYLFIEDDHLEKHVVEVLKENNTKAIVITGKAISKIAKRSDFFNFVRKQRGRTPIMIIDLTPQTDPELLNIVSGGSIKDIRRYRDTQFHGFYRFEDVKEIAHELSGLSLEAEFERLDFFDINKECGVQSIIQIGAGENKTLFPIFVKATIEGLEIFFLSQKQGFKSWDNSGLVDKNRDCSYLLAIGMFIRYSCGDYCWRSPGYFANLAIDDPWLIEPYGYVSYFRLLKEMEKANFHTTISLIPWNYDRSKEEVVSLFRKHPDRFSICIHGNNHDRYEFYKYETSNEDPWPAKPFEVQEDNIKQAITRMEEFKKLTGIPYDMLMVFPYGIAPEKTLEILKKYNFIATLNIDHIPLGSEAPSSDVLFGLRPYTFRFGNFLSIKRYGQLKWSKTEIAIDLFIGNPLLFSGHHNIFEDGIDVFTETAEFVNSLQSDVKWTSMGHIVKHLYLQRIREDGHYDIRSFSKIIELENKQECEMTYFTRKEESFSSAIEKVNVNGKSCPYKRSGNDIAFTVTIPPGETRLTDIEYTNDFNPASIAISKSDSRVKRLRMFADFRDLTLTKYSWGRSLIKGYYKSGVFKYQIKRIAIYSLLFVAIIVSSIVALRTRFKTKRSQVK